MERLELIDQASVTETDFREASIQAARDAAKIKEVRGICLNCGEPVSDLYCDDFCNSQYQAKLKQNKIRGI